MGCKKCGHKLGKNSVTDICPDCFLGLWHGESTPKPAPEPTGAVSISPDGYRQLRMSDGSRKAEHRYVMEQKIGRPLRESETVHHKNGQRADNRLENLEIFLSWHPAGQRIEDVVAWAKDVLRVYDPDSLKEDGYAPYRHIVSGLDPCNFSTDGSL